MSRIKLRYIQSFIDKKSGAVFHYFRRRGHARVRLPGMPGSSEFMLAYHAALDVPESPIGAARNKPGSLSATVAAYYGSLEFGTLAAGTQRVRRFILEGFRARHGDKPLKLLPPQFIAHVLSTMKPHAAKNWLKAIRHFMSFAVAQGFIVADPTSGIKLPKMKKSDGFRTWNEEEIAQFESHHAIGTHARLAFALLLYSAQRRGDVIRFGPQHIRGGALHLRQQKTGAVLAIPVHPELQRVLDATPCQHLTFLTKSGDRPYSGTDFTKVFRGWCEAAGLPKGLSPHGLRKAACRRLAEAGASVHEIMSISGHRTLEQVAHYCRAFDQAKLARAAMARNIGTTPTVKSADA
jgi:integrase